MSLVVYTFGTHHWGSGEPSDKPWLGTEHGSSLQNPIRLKVPHSGGGRSRCGKLSARDIIGGKAYCLNWTRNLSRESGVMNLFVGHSVGSVMSLVVYT